VLHATSWPSLDQVRDDQRFLIDRARTELEARRSSRGERPQLGHRSRRLQGKGAPGDARRLLPPSSVSHVSALSSLVALGADDQREFLAHWLRNGSHGRSGTLPRRASSAGALADCPEDESAAHRQRRVAGHSLLAWLRPS
jgi:hypothetical protein